MPEIDANLSIYEILKQFPEVKTILYDLGFTGIIDPAKLNTVGRYMTIVKGAKIKKIPLSSIKNELEVQGFTLKEREK